MSEDKNGMDEYDPMEEIRQAKEDELLLLEAFDNSYRILTKEISFDEMLEEKFKEDLSAVLAFDPEVGPMLSELESMIEFYIIEEDYKRCAALRDIMHEKYPKSSTDIK